MKSDYMEIGGRNAKSPVLIAGVPSPSSQRFFASLPLPRLRLQRRLYITINNCKQAVFTIVQISRRVERKTDNLGPIDFHYFLTITN